MSDRRWGAWSARPHQDPRLLRLRQQLRRELAQPRGPWPWALHRRHLRPKSQGAAPRGPFAVGATCVRGPTKRGYRGKATLADETPQFLHLFCDKTRRLLRRSTRSTPAPCLRSHAGVRAAHCDERLLCCPHHQVTLGRGHACHLRLGLDRQQKQIQT